MLKEIFLTEKKSEQRVQNWHNENITCGLRKSGIFLLNSGAFTDADFLAAASFNN